MVRVGRSRPPRRPICVTGTRSLQEIAGHLCIDPHTLSVGLERLVAKHWAMLFGAMPQRLLDNGIESQVTQGAQSAGLLLGALVIVAVFRSAYLVAHEHRWRPELDFCAYLVLSGALSAGGYVVAR